MDIDKKRRLNSYLMVSDKVKHLEEALAELKASQFGKAIVNDGMPHSACCSDLSGYASRLDGVERELSEAKRSQVLIKREFRRAVRFLTSTERNVIWSRYICGHMVSETVRLYRMKKGYYYRVLKDAEKKIPLNGGEIDGMLQNAGIGNRGASREGL